MAAREDMQKSLADGEKKFRSIVEQTGDGIVIIDRTGTVIEYNAAQEKTTGVRRKDALGMKVWDLQYSLLPPETKKKVAYAAFKRKYADFLSSGRADWLNTMFEVDVLHRNGSIRVHQTVVSAITTGTETIYCSFNRDVTELRRSEKVREEQNRLLQEKNVALREVLSRLEEEKKRIAGTIQANIDRHVLPVLSRIRSTDPKNVGHYVALLEENLRGVMAPFVPEISRRMHAMSPREIEICNLIKRGLSCKEISKLMNISYRTVETHRSHIRKKLGLAVSSVNLSTYLKGNA